MTQSEECRCAECKSVADKVATSTSKNINQIHTQHTNPNNKK